jgi:hypothetical protein
VQVGKLETRLGTAGVLEFTARSGRAAAHSRCRVPRASGGGRCRQPWPTARRRGPARSGPALDRPAVRVMIERTRRADRTAGGPGRHIAGRLVRDVCPSARGSKAAAMAPGACRGMVASSTSAAAGAAAPAPQRRLQSAAVAAADGEPLQSAVRPCVICRSEERSRVRADAAIPRLPRGCVLTAGWAR